MITSELQAQQNPTGINWKSIDTGTYEIIFPDELEPLGQRVANLMKHYEKYNYSSIKTKPRRIPIVLINNFAEPNGFVSYAPFYSHWFTTPAAFDSIEWFKGLAIHEGRHMVQQNKLKDGIGKKFYRAIAGDYGTALFSLFFIPVWFPEGDSVVMETALTKGGRGRLPSFDLFQRGAELSGERESYYESYIGSYDSLSPYPDHYRLGYILCSYIRKHYGKEVWDRVLTNTGRFIIAPSFNWSLEIETGKSIRELYTAALNEYRTLWENQRNELKITDVEILTPEKKKVWKNLPSFNLRLNFDVPYLPNLAFSAKANKPQWESFLFPSVSDDGTLTAVRFSKDKKLSLIKFGENNETEDIKHLPFEVASTFLMNERIFTTGGGFALWREIVPHPRWGYKSYSDLKLLDLNTGKSKFITDNKKFIASTISRDGKIAAGIEYGPDLKYFLSMIDTETKKEIFRDEIKDKGYLFDPAISADGKRIALSALSDNGYAILLYNIETKKITTLIDYTHNEQLRAPAFYGDILIYGSDYSGIDNLYAIDIKSKKRFQITSRPLGAYFPSLSGDTLYFNDYSATGYLTASIKLDQKKWTPIDKVERRAINYIEPIAEQELTGDNGNINNIPETEYEVKNYYSILHSFNPFLWVWAPFISSTLTELNIFLISKDVLHTTDMVLTFTYNFNEKKTHGDASIIYRGLFPVFTLSGGYGGRAVYTKNPDYDKDKDSKDKKYVYSKWNEATGSAGMSFPLDFSRGIYFTQLNFGAEGGYVKISEKNDVPFTTEYKMADNGDLRYMNYFFSLRSLLQGAMDSIYPLLGEILNVSYSHTPYSGDYLGSLFSADLIFYFPGLTDTQGFKLEGSYEHLKKQSYTFAQEFLFPRGYDGIRHEHLFKGTIDYAFPIVSFSANISKLVYFKRLNGDFFFDYGAGNDSNLEAIKKREEFKLYRSAGFELTAEENILSNKFLSFEMGLRYSRCLDADKNAEYNNDKNRYELVIKTPI